MKVIDRYIIGKFLGTLSFMLILLSIIVVVVDVQQKSPRIEGNGFKVSYFLINYYPYWAIYLIITFMSILIFISVILFTSRMANNTEIVAIISGGASFHRFAKPYFVMAGILAIITLGINHFVLPWANVKKLKLEAYTFNSTNREKALGDTEIATKLSKDEYIFINNYNRKDKAGTGFLYQKFDKNNQLSHQIIANDVRWDDKQKKFTLETFLEKKINKNSKENLYSGNMKIVDYHHTPEELFPDGMLGQTKNSIELIHLIEQEKIKGNKNINSYLNELHQRTSMPVAIIILTTLALSLASEKKRGGIGGNLAMGISLAFVFIFSFEALKMVSENDIIPPIVAMWIPNVVFGIIAGWLYLKRANQ